MNVLDKIKRRALSMFDEAAPLEQMKDLPPSARELKKLIDRYRLSDLLPYETYDIESGIYWNESTLGVLLIGSPATGIDETSLNVLSGIFNQSLAPGTSVQISLFANPNISPILERWKAQRKGEMFSFLAQKRVDYLRQGAWQPLFSSEPQIVRDFQLLVSIEVPKRDDMQRDGPEVEALKRTRESILGVLTSAGISAKPCIPDHFLELMDVLLNPDDQTVSREPLRWDENGDLLRRQMVSEETSIFTGRDSLGLSCNGFDLDVRPFSVRQYPRVWAGWSMSNLIGDLYSSLLRIPCPFIYTMTAEVGDPIAMGRKAKLKTARSTQMAESPMGKFLPAWAERKQEWQFVSGLQESGHRMVSLHWQAVLFSRPKEAEFAEQRFKAVFENRGWRVQRDRFIALPAFLSALPMNAGPDKVKELKQTGRMRTAMSWTAINTAPSVAEWKGTGTPSLMLIGRRGQIQMIDNFDNDKGNYNIAVAAASGAGKSFFTQEMVISTLGAGGRCWAIDSGRSYEEMCKILNGDFLEFGPETNICLNPFTNIKTLAALEENLPMLAKLIEEMATAHNQGLNSLQMSFAQQAISAVWADYGPETTVTKLALWLMENDYPGAQIIGRMLHPYTAEGVYSRFFEGAANIDLNNPFVVLELGELDGKRDLRGVVLMLLIANIAETMYRSDRKQRKLCILDEAWKLMSSGNAGEFIEEGYRTARKFGGAFMTITQSVGDYYRSPISKAALDNSDWTFLLRQKPSTLADAIAKGQISVEGGLEPLLKSLDTRHGFFSEIAVMGPGGASVGRLIVDPFSEKLYSTQATEVQAMRDMQAQGLSLVEAIEKLATAGRR